MNRTASPTRVAVAAVLGLAASVPAVQAHHSSAAYDLSQKATLTGTVKVFQWTNPHCWVTLNVPNGKGGDDEWPLEGGSVSILLRNGWRIDSVRPGDKVKLLISPRRDKAPGGEFFTILEKDGAPFTPKAS